MAYIFFNDKSDIYFALHQLFVGTKDAHRQKLAPCPIY